jgi:hypothetical protein
MKFWTDPLVMSPSGGDVGAELGTKSLFRYSLLSLVTRYSLLVIFYSLPITLVLESTTNDVTSNDLVLYIYYQNHALQSC